MACSGPRVPWPTKVLTLPGVFKCLEDYFDYLMEQWDEIIFGENKHDTDDALVSF